MAAVTQWNPFQEREGTQTGSSSSQGYPDGDLNEWEPPVDVIETGDEFVIRSDLPGVDKSDLSVTLEGGELTLKGSRTEQALPENAQYLVNERAYGTFTRTLVVPSWADASCIQAEFKHGVLLVTVRKPAQAKARTIAIQGE